uniref:Uncharacterized protein n=1 Tax=Plectus sambesii TaxID=2011161 RepID=A0A914V917_9BILA
SNVINPFTLLDGKLTQLLTERGNSATERIDRCAEATVIVRPAVIGEEQALFLTASVRNVRSSGNLNRIRLAVAFEKESADSQEILFSFGQPRLDGISSLGGTGILQPGGSFTAEWRILTNPRLRLTKDSVYQANVLLSFENSLTGQISTQRLDTTP